MLAIGILSAGPTLLILNSQFYKNFFTNDSNASAFIIMDTGPRRTAINEELTKKFCEIIPTFESTNVEDDNDYVTRLSLENRILKASECRMRDKYGHYTILVGPDGAGKSSIVARVLREKKGVVVMKISPLDTWESIILRLFTKCGVNDLGLDYEIPDFAPALRKAAEQRNDLPITFIFEVEGISLERLGVIKRFSKLFAVSSNVIIVLSDANAGLAFCDDPRQKIIWVDAMTTEEAREYAKKLHPTVSDTDLHLLFDKIGTLPRDILLSMVALKDGIPVTQIIQKTVAVARSDITSFTYQPIITALKSSPDGVNSGKFSQIFHKGAHLAEEKDVLGAMDNNAIIYHIPSREYRLASRAHRTALLQESK
jgi:GTPase SAR1 family protein